jgi:hypothetical protein
MGRRWTNLQLSTKTITFFDYPACGPALVRYSAPTGKLLVSGNMTDLAHY